MAAFTEEQVKDFSIKNWYDLSGQVAVVTGGATGLGLAWKAGVAAEVLCRPAWAVGTQIVQARDYLETPSLFAWTLVVLLLSLALEKLLSALLNRINRRWSP